MPDGAKCVVLWHGMMNSEDVEQKTGKKGGGSASQKVELRGGVQDSVQDAGAQVIQKGEARLIVHDSDQAAQPEAKIPRPITIEPRVASAAKQDPDPEVIESPHDEYGVTLLEQTKQPRHARVKPEKVKFEKLTERPSEDEIQEEQWGQSAKQEGGVSGAWRMILIGGGVVIAVVVALVVVHGIFDGQTVKAEEPYVLNPIQNEENLFEGSPEKWFRDRSATISEVALKVLKGYVAAQDTEGRAQWVRNPQSYRQASAHWPVKVDPILSYGNLSWDIGHTDDVAYLILKTRDQEYLPFRVYFTCEEGELKLDWAATTAWSKVSLRAIRSAAEKKGGPITEEQLHAGVVEASGLSPSSKPELPTEIYTDSVLVRCMIRKRDEFYAGPYNDLDHSAYMLLSADKMHHMWGYALRGSDLDLALRAILDHGSFVVRLKKDKRVTLRVKVNPKSAFPSQVELVELVNLEWVTPIE